MVKHIKEKDLRNIALHYKVDSITVSDEFDISVLFVDFCLSMKEYWNIRMINQIESFSFLLLLCELNQEQNSKIVKAFVNLLTISENENIHVIINNIYALSIYVKAHFDKGIKKYVDLLDLLINSDILLEAYPNAYPDLIGRLSVLANEKIYNDCCIEFEKINGNSHQRTLWVFMICFFLITISKIVQNLNFARRFDSLVIYQITMLTARDTEIVVPGNYRI